MIYTSLYVMIFDACSITWASGRVSGPGNLEFFWPQMALPYWLDAISQGPKTHNFQAHPPPTCPSNGSARIKNITHGAL
jgi:hypothetical protein